MHVIQFAPIDFFFKAVMLFMGRFYPFGFIINQARHIGFTGLAPTRGMGQVIRQFKHALDVLMQNFTGMHAQRHARSFWCDERVSIPVSSYP